jgi:hypothetical protein
MRKSPDDGGPSSSCRDPSHATGVATSAGDLHASGTPEQDARRGDGGERDRRQHCGDQILRLRHLSHLPSLEPLRIRLERLGVHSRRPTAAPMGN